MYDTFAHSLRSLAPPIYIYIYIYILLSFVHRSDKWLSSVLTIYHKQNVTYTCHHICRIYHSFSGICGIRVTYSTYMSKQLVYVSNKEHTKSSASQTICEEWSGNFPRHYNVIMGLWYSRLTFTRQGTMSPSCLAYRSSQWYTSPIYMHKKYNRYASPNICWRFHCRRIHATVQTC